MARLIILLLIFFIAVPPLTPSYVYAQAPPREVEEDFPSGPRKQLATIIFSGLAGAILGLSTLSFYGRPQDKLSNIAVGFALGIIIGASYTTYKAAMRPYDIYEEAEYEEPPILEPFWDSPKELAHFEQEPIVPGLQFQWSF